MASTSGRKNNQKMKPYIVYNYLLRNSDENHVVGAPEIVGYLQEMGIEAERRSIYRDIEEINKAIWIIENDADIDMVEESMDDGSFDDEKMIVYDSQKKGFYIRQRKYDATDIRLISECVYSSRYITQKEAERLVDIMREFISDYQSEEIKMDALVTNRNRTLNKNTLNNVSIIYDSMSKKIYGESHKPEKISFKYTKYSIENINQAIERKEGATYVVSPYKLIINDGNYYLLAFDDNHKEIRTYRVDRMKNIKRTGEPREGKEEFAKIDLESYTQRVFSMYTGQQERIRLQFPNYLLDTAIERFGRSNNVSYSRSDEHHFVVYADVEVSDQFFGWLCGFGSKVKILAPSTVVDKYKEYLDKIRDLY